MLFSQNLPDIPALDSDSGEEFAHDVGGDFEQDDDNSYAISTYSFDEIGDEGDGGRGRAKTPRLSSLPTQERNKTNILGKKIVNFYLP